MSEKAETMVWFASLVIYVQTHPKVQTPVIFSVHFTKII